MAPSGFQIRLPNFELDPVDFLFYFSLAVVYVYFFVVGRSGNPIPIELISDRVFGASVMFRPRLFKNVFRATF